MRVQAQLQDQDPQDFQTDHGDQLVQCPIPPPFHRAVTGKMTPGYIASQRQSAFKPEPLDS